MKINIFVSSNFVLFRDKSIVIGVCLLAIVLGYFRI